MRGEFAAAAELLLSPCSCLFRSPALSYPPQSHHTNSQLACIHTTNAPAASIPHHNTHTHAPARERKKKKISPGKTATRARPSLRAPPVPASAPHERASRAERIKMDDYVRLMGKRGAKRAGAGGGGRSNRQYTVFFSRLGERAEPVFWFPPSSLWAFFFLLTRGPLSPATHQTQPQPHTPRHSHRANRSSDALPAARNIS